MLCDCSGGEGGALLFLFFSWGVLVSFCVSKVVFRKFPRKSVWGDSLCVFSLGRPPSFLGGSPTVCLCLLACVCLFFSFVGGPPTVCLCLLVCVCAFFSFGGGGLLLCTFICSCVCTFFSPFFWGGLLVSVRCVVLCFVRVCF